MRFPDEWQGAEGTPLKSGNHSHGLFVSLCDFLFLTITGAGGSRKFIICLKFKLPVRGMHGPQVGCEGHKGGLAITSLLLPCVSGGMNSSHHDGWQKPLPTEPSYQSGENLSSSFIITLSLVDQV